MLIHFRRARELLQGFQFRELFIEELGWANVRVPPLMLEVDGVRYRLTPIAEQGGMFVFEVKDPGNDSLPKRTTRLAIERKLTRRHHEHLLIFTNAARTVSVWQWVKREIGRAAAREHRYDRTQPGDLLLQKLAGIAFRFEDLDEEGKTTIMDVTDRVKRAFDVERVTKRFYDEFKKHHDAFLKFIEGIEQLDHRQWYASVMLNRLMFIYFIQKKGFLDSDPDYLATKLETSKARGTDRYYRDVLCPLFFEGFARRPDERSPEVNARLGHVPYLNGGLFLPHPLEKEHPDIAMADEAFERLFEFFDAYTWHLDDRPLRADNEINPDVLGYIFEKYINQKQMGAYYTKEDITGYISKNTIIPFIFDAAAKKCPAAFKGERSVWTLLQEDPDRYIYPAVKKGVDLPLPPDIAAGLNDVSKRTAWNRSAPEEYALPTEIWREVVARRQRYEETVGVCRRQTPTAGEIQSINDLITYNLDICQFAQDVLEDCDTPELLRAFYHAIEQVTVLDPTCGSGAFLFAALNILEPLYEACLNRMQAFVDELDHSGEKHRPEKFSDFRKTLERVQQHPNRHYFIYKSIVVNNLYGVDIMEEAVEICKLRLFLKLVAQVERVENIEPLPDIDFNIRAGNTLVGFATYDDVKRAVTSTLDLYNSMACIEEKAQDVDRLFGLFRAMQTERGMDAEDFADAKRELGDRLKALEDELNRYLAGEYGVDPHKKIAYEKWLASHRPFHWFIEFYGILKNGGFDVIIGNPPYVEYSKVRKDYALRSYDTGRCGNLYAFVMERSLDLLRGSGRCGMIVQLPIVCTDRMKLLQRECLDQSNVIWFANFDDRPAKLFEGLQHIRACIATTQKGKSRSREVYSTSYNRWYSEVRAVLFESLSFVEIADYLMEGAIPKIGQPLAKSVRYRIDSFPSLLKYLTAASQHTVYFHNSPQYWIRAMDFTPYFWNERDGEQISTQVKSLHLPTQLDASVVVATLNSSLFYWWFVVLSDCRHLNLREIENFPIGLERMSEVIKHRLAKLTDELMDDLKRHAQRKECYYKTTGQVVYDEFYPKYSKPIIDEIDRVLAQHYGFTDEELDFIVNYDIKYRMGREVGR